VLEQIRRFFVNEAIGVLLVRSSHDATKRGTHRPCNKNNAAKARDVQSHFDERDRADDYSLN